MRPSSFSSAGFQPALKIAFAILLAACLLGLQTARPESSKGAKAVLHDATHTTNLIFERVREDGLIVETQTWSVGSTSRIIKSTYSEAGELKARSASVTHGRRSTRTDATITPQGAHVTSINGRPSTIPVAGHLGIVDPSLHWFDGKPPANDTTANFMSFNPEFRYWEQVTVVYQGRGKIGKSPEGYLVTRQDARSTIHLLLDDKGMPLVWEEGRTRLTR